MDVSRFVHVDVGRNITRVATEKTHLPRNSASQDIVKAIAGVLATAGISSVLWGDHLLITYGVPSIVGGIEFIVKDEDIPAAIAVLEKTNLLPCPDPETCLIPSDRNPSSSPEFHMHVPEESVDVSLRKHSETLWFMPPLSSSLFRSEEDCQKNYYALATDTQILPPPGRPGRGRGVFSSSEGDRDLVIVPLQHNTLEAYIRLASRHRGTYLGRFSRSMMTYMGEYVDADGMIDCTLLSEPCRRFWGHFKGGEVPLRELMDTLQYDLKDKE